MPENVNDLEKTTGQKILAVLKFIIFTLIKMIFIVLTLLSLFIAIFGVGFKLMQELCKNGLVNMGDNKIIIVLAGLIASACFFLTKTFHNILRPYFWPAVGGLTIFTAVFVVVAVVFEPNFANALEHGTSTRTEENYTENENQRNISNHKENSSGLIWSSKAHSTMDWHNAATYCKNLSEDGFDDWRLPNIDELMTLLIADKVTTKCKVSEKNNCLSNKDCWSCSTCTQNGVEDSSHKYKICSDWGTEYNDGRYSKLGDSDWFWSSSSMSDLDGIWGVYFASGVVMAQPMNKNRNVRCVRGGNNQTASQNKTEKKRSESAKQTKTKCNFSIQLLARQSKNEAIEEAERYRPMKTRIIEADVNGTTWYRLRTGCFDSKNEANKALPKVKNVVKDAMVLPE